MPETLLSPYPRRPSRYDEMLDGRGTPRAHWRPFLGQIAALPAATIRERGRFVRELTDLHGEVVAEFTARLSDAVRRYVEAADGLPTLRRTPREIAPLAEGAARLRDLPELLRRCDEARFSRVPLDADSRAALLAAAAKLAEGPP